MNTTENTNPITDSVKNIFSSGSDRITDTANNIKSSINSDYFNNNSLYIGLILVVIICFVIAYVLYTIITTKLFLNIRQIADETKVPVLCSERKKIPFLYDKTGNGERRSYTFWIYIHDMNKYKDSYKNVFSLRENSKSSVKLDDASPFIFLDKTNNRMYVRFASTNVNDETKNIDYTGITEASLAKIMKQGIVIPYVPLQRWVHIAIVCNANSYKNYIYAYVDGDLVNTTSHNEDDKYLTNCDSTATAKCKKFLTNINLNVSGTLSIGGTANDFAEGPGFSGLVSKITSYNYELNQKDIYDDYYNGPVGGLMAKLGLGMFGIRSPIYKL